MLRDFYDEMTADYDESNPTGIAIESFADIEASAMKASNAHAALVRPAEPVSPKGKVTAIRHSFNFDDLSW